MTTDSQPPTDQDQVPPQARGMSAERLWLFRLVAVAFALVLAIVVVEVGARLFVAARPNDMEALRKFNRDKRSGKKLTLIHFVRPSDNPRMVFELIPGIEGEFRGVPLRVNSAGFRDPERTTAKPAGTFRIAALGDSILFGWGVTAESRFTDLLEHFLNETASQGQRFEVLNFGVPGYNTVLEAECLKSRALAYQPDAVLLTFCLSNDAAMPNFVSRKPNLWTLRRSYAWEALRRRSVSGIRENMGVGLQGADANNVPPQYQYLVGWDRANEALGEIPKTCAASHAPVLFLMDYWTVEDYRGASAKPASEDPAEPVYERVSRLGYSVVNPRETLVTYLDSNRLHSYALCVAPKDGDAHPNSIRHAIYAKLLYGKLVENGVLPDASARKALLPEHLKRWDAIIDAARKATPIDKEYQLAEPR
jgi:lysophospholipase L1-like esterase